MTDSDGDAQSLLSEARPSTSDAVAAVLRAKVREGLLGPSSAPAMIGRFSVLNFVGAGAAGTVYAAYDPVLDRKVALKVLAPSAVSYDDLLEEARALAKLRHPNVVAVHEAGHVGDQVYVAMEFVDGHNLRVWLRDSPRTSDQIVQMLVQAGRGLAAAHAAGIAHGDFKPDNVLVGDDGVRVADFGMARAVAAQAEGPGGGTPAYMAPERLHGGPATEAADQFAFGVALVEALTGKRPFEGQNVDALRYQTENERPALPRKPGIAGRALQIAKKSLHPDPSQRYASMDDLLSALGPKPRLVGTQRWVLLAAAVVVAAAVGLQQSGKQDPCAAGEALAMEAASDETLTQIRAAIGTHSQGLDDALPDRVEDRLTAYRANWQRAHRSACEATRVDGTQSDSLYDLRMRCLERRREELTALGSALARVSTPREAARAVSAVDTLVDLAQCDADRVSKTDYAEPEDAEQRKVVASLRRDISDAWADYHLARYDAALAAAQTLEEKTGRLAFASLSAEATYLLGTVEARVLRPNRAEATLRRARVLAGTAKADGLAADISVQLLRTVMFGGEPNRVAELADFAFADVARSSRPPAEVEGILGEAKLHAGDPSGAMVSIESALTKEQRPYRRAVLLATRASAQLAQGDASAALADYESALALAISHYGASHPTVAFFRHRVGRGQLAVGQKSEALETLTLALQQREAALGAHDRAVASTLIDLAMAARQTGDLELAQSSLTRALAIRRTAYGEQHPSLAEVHVELAKLAEAGHDTDAAASHRALAAELGRPLR